MINDVDQFKNFLECLKEAKCLGNVILIGSWSEHLYESCIENFQANMATIDLDFLIPDLNQPEEKIRLSSIAEKYGFEYSEKGEPAYSVFTGKDGFEVEFISELRGDGIRDPKASSNLGVKTQPLRHVRLLKDFTDILSYRNVMVRVPMPEAYCLQKMIVNSDRLLSGKTVSDQKKIENIVPFLNAAKVSMIFDTLAQKEKDRVNAYVKAHYKKNDIYELFNIEQERGFVPTPELDSKINDLATYMRKVKQNDNKFLTITDDKSLEKLLKEQTDLRSRISKLLNESLTQTELKEDAKEYILMKLSKLGIHSPKEILGSLISEELDVKIKDDDIDI